MAFMDPISVTVAIHGESAILQSPASTASYDPTASGDYTPLAPGDIAVRGVPELKIEDTVPGAKGAFTFSATSRPVGLEATSSKLAWRGKTWTVLEVRERTFLGNVNGYTLYLGI